MSKEEPLHDLRIADRMQAVIGWRIWLVTRTGFLYSPFQSHHGWPGFAPLRAGCYPRDLPAIHRDGVPSANHRCGIFATKSVAEAWLWARELDENDESWVIGKVALWGTVHEHERGFRAQFAYPQLLYLPDYLQPLKDTLYAHYGVELRPVHELGLSRFSLPTKQAFGSVLLMLYMTALLLGLPALFVYTGLLRTRAEISLFLLLPAVVCLLGAWVVHLDGARSSLSKGLLLAGIGAGSAGVAILFMQLAAFLSQLL